LAGKNGTRHRDRSGINEIPFIHTPSGVEAVGNRGIQVIGVIDDIGDVRLEVRKQLLLNGAMNVEVGIDGDVGSQIVAGTGWKSDRTWCEGDTCQEAATTQKKESGQQKPLLQDGGFHIFSGLQYTARMISPNQPF
jgi:hypothetical protein